MPAEVLVIEDSPTQALRIRLILEQAGLAVTWAQTGQVGIEAAVNHPPSAIVLDVNLPDIDGFHVCRRLKEHPATTATPVVMLTIKERAADALTGLEAGADAYIPKDNYAEINLMQALRDLAILRHRPGQPDEVRERRHRWSAA